MHAADGARGASPGDARDAASGIEVSVAPGSKEGSEHVVVLRDRGDPKGVALVFTPGEWKAFVAGVDTVRGLALTSVEC